MSAQPTSFALLSSTVLRPGEGMAADQDGFFLDRDENHPDQVLVGVVDGAGVRLPGLPEALSGSALPAQALRALRRASGQRGDPAGWLLAANDALHEALMAQPFHAAIFPLLEGPVQPLLTALAAIGPVGDALEEAFDLAFDDVEQLDTRYLRLCLPAIVATVAHLDLWTREVRWAHLGDTAMLRASEDRVTCVTPDQMERFDIEALTIAQDAVRAGDAPTMFEARLLPRVRRADLRNGVRHNYTDEHGLPKVDEGCGVINGQSACADFIEQGSFFLERGETLALLTDGLLYPLRLDDPAPINMAAARNRWQEAMLRCDAGTLLEAVERMIATDPDGTILPRFKRRDDGAAVLIRLA